MKMKTAWFDEMNWMEVKQAIKDAKGIVIIPIGCLEQWGHLPVGCDNFQAVAHVKKVIELAQKDKDIKQILALPVLPMGYQPYMADFPGTISVRQCILREYYKDIAESLIKFGVTKFIWSVGHSGNCPPLIDMGRELKDKYGILTVIDRAWATRGEAAGPRTPEQRARGGHASGSFPFAEIRPEIIKEAMKKAKVWIPKGKPIQGWTGVDDFTDPAFDDALGVLTAKLKTSVSSQGEPLTVYMVGSYQEATPYGSMGDPTGAKVEDSYRDLEVAAKHTIAIIKAIEKIKVPLKSSPKEDISNL